MLTQSQPHRHSRSDVAGPDDPPVGTSDFDCAFKLWNSYICYAYRGKVLSLPQAADGLCGFNFVVRIEKNDTARVHERDGTSYHGCNHCQQCDPSNTHLACPPVARILFT